MIQKVKRMLTCLIQKQHRKVTISKANREANLIVHRGRAFTRLLAKQQRQHSQRILDDGLWKISAVGGDVKKRVYAYTHPIHGTCFSAAAAVLRTTDAALRAGRSALHTVPSLRDRIAEAMGGQNRVLITTSGPSTKFLELRTKVMEKATWAEVPGKGLLDERFHLSDLVVKRHDLLLAVCDTYSISGHSTNFYKGLPRYFQSPQHGQSRETPNPSRWTNQNLIENEGHILLNRSTVVVDAKTLHIVGVFTLGKDMSAEIYSLSALFPDLIKVTDKCGGRARGSIYMVGLKNSSYSGNVTQFYANTITADERERSTVMNVARRLTQVENLISPALGAFKAQMARENHFPGLFPGEGIDGCSAGSMGASVGYASPPHRDHSSIENIMWDSRDGPKDGSYGFSLYSARVICDLGSDDACSVLVAGSCAHGTTCTSKKKHGGIGVVLVQKHNLLTESSREQNKVLCAKRWI